MQRALLIIILFSLSGFTQNIDHLERISFSSIVLNESKKDALLVARDNRGFYFIQESLVDSRYKVQNYGLTNRQAEIFIRADYRILVNRTIEAADRSIDREKIYLPLGGYIDTPAFVKKQKKQKVRERLQTIVDAIYNLQRGQRGRVYIVNDDDFLSIKDMIITLK